MKLFKNNDVFLICLYVDDFIFTGTNPKLFEDFKRAMSLEFEMMDIGIMSYYLGLEVKQMEDEIFISQESYAREVLKKFKMLDCNPVNTPMEFGMKLSRFNEEHIEDPTLFKSLMESLRYLTCTRPNILFVVGVISRFMKAPTSTHMKAANRILRYLKGTTDYGLLYSSSIDFKLVRFSDNDFVGNIDDRKKHYWFCIFHG